MKKFRQLIRECGEGTVMYNHLHMNLLKAGLVHRPRGAGTARQRGSRGRSRGRGRARQSHRHGTSAASSSYREQQGDIFQAPLDLAKHNDVSSAPATDSYANDCSLAQDQRERDLQFELNLEQHHLRRQQQLEGLASDPLNLTTNAHTYSGNSTERTLISQQPLPGYGDCPLQNGGRGHSREFAASYPVPPPNPPNPHAPNVGIAFVKEIVDCIFPDLSYRPLAAHNNQHEYLEVTRRQATLLPRPSAIWSDAGVSNSAAGPAVASNPCHPARILVSPEGMVEFQAANRTLCTVEALSVPASGGDSTSWRKSILECVQNLTERSGYQFCPGFGWSSNSGSSGSPLAAPSTNGATSNSFRCDDIVASDFGLGYRSVSCELWFRPRQMVDYREDVVHDATQLRTASEQASSVDDTPSLESISASVSETFGACANCLDVVQRYVRDRSRKQRHPQKMQQPPVDQ